MEYALGVDYINLTTNIINVLILVVMEYALGDEIYQFNDKRNKVLILVVMEYALGEKKKISSVTLNGGLNPCCNGICSRRDMMEIAFRLSREVLILVVMEYALGEFTYWGTLVRQMS